jgi:hypothetical protein
MGIYFLIAIALSAMSAATEVQVSRPCLAQVQRVRAERRAIRAVRKSSGGQAPTPVRTGREPLLRRIAILCGAASPRAPAFGC